LAPPEDGIKRFEFTTSESGPIGVRFSGGFPPLIIGVTPDSSAAKKKVPLNFEVHAINGHALVTQNLGLVMSSLKSRPVTLDVRPIGWKPKEKVLEIERKRALDDAEHNARVEMELQRRDVVDKQKSEQDEIDAIAKAERDAIAKADKAERVKNARASLAAARAVENEFTIKLNLDPEPLRREAESLMDANYGSSVKPENIGRRGLPLRLMTRRKEVAWLWAGVLQELIGGGAPDAGSSFGD